MLTFTTGAALIIGAAACATDLHSRRIPNWLTFGASAGALAFHYLTAGQDGVVHAMGGWVIGLVLFLPMFLLGGMGAGDVKLLAALGAWLGPGYATLLAMYSSLAGGLIAVPMAMRQNYLGTAFKNIGSLARFWWYCGVRPLRRVSLESSAAPRLAYAVPMFLGMVIALWLH